MPQQKCKYIGDTVNVIPPSGRKPSVTGYPVRATRRSNRACPPRERVSATSEPIERNDGRVRVQRRMRNGSRNSRYEWEVGSHHTRGSESGAAIESRDWHPSRSSRSCSCAASSAMTCRYDSKCPMHCACRCDERVHSAQVRERWPVSIVRERGMMFADVE